MRLEGASLQECANRFGVSREYIRQITPPATAYARKRSSYETCVYPNLAQWLYENRYSYNAFAKLCATSYAIVFRALTGECDFRKALIDKILDATGMTYEEAFKK